MSDTVRMIRVLDEGEKGPSTADVHPDEVTNYQKAGWGIDNSDGGDGGGGDPLLNILKGNAASVIAILPDKTEEELVILLQGEQAKSQPRKGVLEAIAAEGEKRTQAE